MKRELSPVQLAVILLLGCIALRLLNGLFPGFIPNISPLMALAYVGAMYLPRRWGWLVGPAAFIVTDMAFLPMNGRVSGTMFSWWTLISLAIYLLAGGLGILISRRKSLVRILSGSVACSLVFYIVANTYCWVGNIVSHATPAYPASLTGWWQANWTGLPGYIPTWTFLRNGVAGDLFFVLALLLVLDRAILFGRASARATVRAA